MTAVTSGERVLPPLNGLSPCRSDATQAVAGQCHSARQLRRQCRASPRSPSWPAPGSEIPERRASPRAGMSRATTAFTACMLVLLSACTSVRPVYNAPLQAASQQPGYRMRALDVRSTVLRNRQPPRTRRAWPLRTLCGATATSPGASTPPMHTARPANRPRSQRRNNCTVIRAQAQLCVPAHRVIPVPP